MPLERKILSIRRCDNCSAEFSVTSQSKKQKFCSRSCTRPTLSLTDPTDEEKEGGYRLIPLSQGQFAKVDTLRYEWAMQWKWTAWWSPNSQSFYAVRNRYRPECRTKPERVIMARAILQAQIGVTVDHKDHDTLNNCDYNLRIATYSQNACNSRMRKNKSSQYKGVQWRGRSGKWMAIIQFEGKVKYLGLFKSEEAAYSAYVEAASILHGDFAYGRIHSKQIGRTPGRGPDTPKV